VTATAATRRPAHLRVVEVVTDLTTGAEAWRAEVGRYRARRSARERVAASQRREQTRRQYDRRTTAEFVIEPIPMGERS
jgi:hypothetical protein